MSRGTEAPLPQECEIKLSLDPQAYARLRARLPGREDEVTQRNLFLDTPDAQLRARRWALRLRHEQRVHAPPRVIATVKGAATRVVGAVRRTEVEAPAEPALWERGRAGELRPGDLPALLGDHLRQALAPDARLVPVLDFENHRTTFRLELDGGERLVELDRTRFSTGQLDHELELELELPTLASGDPSEAVLEIHAVSQALRTLLALHGVRARPSEAGKYARALRYAGQ